MEYVIVKYYRKRTVLVDDEEAGFSNTTLGVEAGTHNFSLGNPINYKPPSIEKQVVGTTPVKPMEVRFEKL